MHRLLTLAVVVLGTIRVGADEAPTLFRPFAWLANETESAHVSIGRLKGAYPVWNVDTGLGVGVADCGYVLTGLWTETDLTDRYRGVHRQCFHEIDPLIAYGYRWGFAEGWSLDSRAGLQWNYMGGYFDDNRRSYDEWQWREELETPWVTVWWQMRNFYWPTVKASWRFGASRRIPLVGGLSLEPCLWFDGGSERWNRQRFGCHDPERIGRGINTMTMRFFLSYRLAEELELYGGLTQYAAIDGDVRHELQANPSKEGKADLLIGTLGIRWNFR